MTKSSMIGTEPLGKSVLDLMPLVSTKASSGEAAARRTGQPGAVGSWFEREVLIRFAHCDPAGIVFYPQYFVIMNGLMEDWFTEGLGVDFANMVTRRRIGIPTVSIDCTFSRPSRVGERVTFRVSVSRVGDRSINVEVLAVANGELRLQAAQTIVMMCLDTMKSIPIPLDIRAELPAFRR